MAEWLQTVNGAGLDLPSLRALVKARMAQAKVLRIIGASPPPAQSPLEFWRSVGEAIGENVDVIEDSLTGELVRADGQWMDVRFEPERSDTYRHHNVGQPLHTDGAYVGDACAREITLFYLERQAESGGESLFVSADAVAACARARDGGLYRLLTTMPVCFGKGAGAQRKTTILRAEDGATKINWNYFRVLPAQGEAIGALRERFFFFLEDMIARGDVKRFRLDAGDAVFFRDDEVLHGRLGFAAKQSGDRLLWKTYFSPSRASAKATA